MNDNVKPYHQHQKEFFEAREKANEIKRYREALIKYGIIPFLMVLERFESEERYELCQLIIDTLKRANIGLRNKYPLSIKQSAEYNKTDKTIIEFTLKVNQEKANQCYNYLLNNSEHEIPMYIDHNLCSTNWIHKFK